LLAKDYNIKHYAEPIFNHIQTPQVTPPKTEKCARWGETGSKHFYQGVEATEDFSF
jgi:hypothetical protein